jgi:CBS-domain-containing membrane protein
MTAPATARRGLGARVGTRLGSALGARGGPWLGPALGAVVLLAPLAVTQAVTGVLFCTPPLAASAALVAATPAAPAARPLSIAASHIVSAATGLGIAALLGHGLPAAVVAVPPAVALLAVLGRSHVPAVASAALVGAAGSWRLAVGVAAGAVLLALIHGAVNALRTGRAAHR